MSAQSDWKKLNSTFLYFLFYSGPQLIGSCPLTLRRTIRLNPLRILHAFFIQKHCHRHTRKKKKKSLVRYLGIFWPSQVNTVN